VVHLSDVSENVVGRRKSSDKRESSLDRRKTLRRRAMYVVNIRGCTSTNDNCKWYSSLPLGAVVSLFCELD
jgi:hypothetical protein